ncbi:hypothetical protein Scep_022506 [Stephania cephalantha]|uniref:Uncharacterized protein n=1 Tax=Stephania cephalantha TaxID=152367 RepID=A0AAP0FB97_9MAGN
MRRANAAARGSSRGAPAARGLRFAKRRVGADGGSKCETESIQRAAVAAADDAMARTDQQRMLAEATRRPREGGRGRGTTTTRRRAPAQRMHHQAQPALQANATLVSSGSLQRARASAMMRAPWWRAATAKQCERGTP